MSRRYLYGRNARYRGTIGDYQTANIQAVLVQPASTYLTENPTTMAGFSALTPLTASSAKVIASITATPNVTRDILYLTAADPAWTGLTPGEIVAGIVIYLFVTNFNSSIPLYAIERPVQATIPAGGTFTWEWNDDGILEA